MEEVHRGRVAAVLAADPELEVRLRRAALLAGDPHQRADAVDVASAPMAGTTSQPSFSALVAALAHTERDTGIPLTAVADLEPYYAKAEDKMGVTRTNGIPGLPGNNNYRVLEAGADPADADAASAAALALETTDLARTDLRAVEGLDAAIARMKALVEAGADAIFPEALKDIGEFETVCRELEPLGVPVLANMTEFGKSELFTRRQLADAGVAMVIYPVTLLRSAMGAAERVLHAIKEEGTQQSQVEQMLTRARLYELVDYEGYNAFDTGIFNFDVPTLDIGANHADL